MFAAIAITAVALGYDFRRARRAGTGRGAVLAAVAAAAALVTIAGAAFAGTSIRPRRASSEPAAKQPPRPAATRRSPTDTATAPSGKNRRAKTPPAPTATALTAPDAATFVRGYYRALDDHRYEQARGCARTLRPRATSAASRTGRGATANTLSTARARSRLSTPPGSRTVTLVLVSPRQRLRRRAELQGHMAPDARGSALHGRRLVRRRAHGAALRMNQQMSMPSTLRGREPVRSRTASRASTASRVVRLAWPRARGTVPGRCSPQRCPGPRKAHARRSQSNAQGSGILTLDLAAYHFLDARDDLCECVQTLGTRTSRARSTAGEPSPRTSSPPAGIGRAPITRRYQGRTRASREAPCTRPLLARPLLRRCRVTPAPACLLASRRGARRPGRPMPGSLDIPPSPDELGAAAGRSRLPGQRRAHEPRAEARCDADGDLAQAARKHADDMVQRNFFAHVSPNGESVRRPHPRSRLRRARRRLAVGRGPRLGHRRRATPNALVDAWLASPPHRRIMLEAGYRSSASASRRAPQGPRLRPPGRDVRASTWA